MNLRTTAFIVSALGLILGFQNCSKVSASDLSGSGSSMATLANGSDTGAGSPVDNNPSGNDGSSSSVDKPSCHDGGSSENDKGGPACQAKFHVQYILDQVVVDGMTKDLSSLKQNLQMQLIQTGKSCSNPVSLKVQGEGLCTAFHGTLLESQSESSQVYQDIFSVAAASDNSSACKAGSFEEEIYQITLNTLNQSDSVDFQANGDLAVHSGKTLIVFVPKH